jgi:site-specific recombinase XerD
MTVDKESLEIIERYFGYSSLSPGTKKTYYRSYSLLLNFTGKKLLELNTDEIVKFRASRSNLKRTTLNKDIMAINSLFQFIEKHDLGSNITKGIDLFKLKKSEKIKERYITHEQALVLIEQPLLPKIMDPTKTRIRDHAVLATLYYAGLRTSEVSNLKWKHVNFEDSTLFVEESKGHRSRSVDVPDKLIKILIHLKEKIKITKYDEYVFTSKGRNNISTDAVRNIVEKYVKMSKIKASGDTTNITPVVLRHSYATHLTSLGVSSFVLGEMMGNPTAVNRYAHTTKEARKRAASLMNGE